jgi:hypothetical protein
MADDALTPKTNLRAVLLTGIVSLVVGVGSGLLINYLTEKSPSLTYDITTQEVFPGEQHTIGIFALRVANDGKREIEQLFCQIRFLEGQVTERRVAGLSQSARTIGGTGRDVDVSVPFLNPGEQFSIQVLLADVKQPLPRPSVEVRGKGITGKEAQSEGGSRKPISELLSVAIAAIATLLTAFATLWTSRMSRRSVTLEALRESANPKHHSADQRDTIAYAMEAHGLPNDAAVIREWPRQLSYWAASDILCSKWIREGDREHAQRGLVSLEFLTQYAAIAEDSRRIIALNMARLALAIGDGEMAKNHLRIAREKRDLIVAKRLKNDASLTSLAGDGV